MYPRQRQCAPSIWRRESLFRACFLFGTRRANALPNQLGWTLEQVGHWLFFQRLLQSIASFHVWKAAKPFSLCFRSKVHFNHMFFLLCPLEQHQHGAYSFWTAGFGFQDRGLQATTFSSRTNPPQTEIILDDLERGKLKTEAKKRAPSVRRGELKPGAPVIFL